MWSAGGYSESDAAAVMKQIFTALLYIHGKGIVHGDIKPENFMYLNKADEPLKVRPRAPSCAFCDSVSVPEGKPGNLLCDCAGVL